MTTQNAVAYMRYSSDNQHETSIEYQRAKINFYCAANGIALVHEYIDRAFSATNDNRPDFQALIEDARNHPLWDTILVYDLSRFFRNYADAVHYKSLLKDLGIKVTSVTQDFGSSNESFLIEGITDLLNDYFSRDNAKKTHAGMVVKSQKAGHCGGVPPLGYDLDANGQLVINKAETVRRIFDMFELNYSYSQMAEILNREGRKNKRGGSFSKSSFHSLLQQEKYTGIYIWNKSRAKNSKHKRNSHACKPLDEQISIRGGCPQIICTEQFQRVQQKMAERACGKASSKSRRHYMLTGLNIVKCAECGAYMTGVSRSSKHGSYTTYSCPNHRNSGCKTKEIRTVFVDTMVAYALSRDLYHRADLLDLSAAMHKDNDTYKKLSFRTKQLKKSIENITHHLESEDSEALVTRLRALESEKQSVDRQLAVSKTGIDNLNKSSLKPLCRQFCDLLKTSDAPEVKAYLSHAVKEVLIGNDDVKITLNIA